MVAYESDHTHSSFHRVIPTTVTVAHVAIILVLCLSGVFRIPIPASPPTLRVKVISPPRTPQAAVPDLPTPPKKEVTQAAAPTPVPTPPPPTPAKRDVAPAPAKPPVRIPPKQDVAPTPPKRIAPPDVAKPPTPKPKPVKRWEAVSADEIRRNANIKPPTPRRRVEVDPNRIANSIANQIPETKPMSIPARSPQVVTPTRTTSLVAQRYYDAVAAALHQIWQQPTQSEVGAGNPTVTVRLVINQDGSISSRAITDRSTAGAMNATVSAALQAAGSMPPPSEYGLGGASTTVTLVFRLTD